MANYDFKSLHHVEFQTLVNDLLSAEWDVLVERFPEGPDQGIDGRFQDSSDRLCIVQAKHYVRSEVAKLISVLVKEEKPKLDVIKPGRYLVGTSVPLSPAKKAEILKKMAPHILSTDDIFGQDDINALISRHPSIEFQHHKLWIHSSAVLNRFIHSGIHNATDMLIKDAVEASAYYAKTSQHDVAQSKLDEWGVLVITGEPGVGKTTLAVQLLLQYVHEGYEPVVINKDIQEAFKMQREEKQIFYFDDFLGSNFLECIEDKSDSRIMLFIKGIMRQKKSKFILTSRTNILDQGYRLSQVFTSDGLTKKEFILDIKEFTKSDKAFILLNFLWKSDVAREFLEEFVSKTKYKTIIKHKNFNPRLLEAITQIALIACSTPGEYMEYVDESLKNPQYVWGRPYDTQCDDLSRAIIDFVVLSGGAIKEDDLRETFTNYKDSRFTSPQSNLSDDFYNMVKPLTRTFVNRQRINEEDVLYSPFNPSISDFIFSKYKNDHVKWARMVAYFPRNIGLQGLKSIQVSEKLVFEKVIRHMFDALVQGIGNQNKNQLFLSTLYDMLDDEKLSSQLIQMVELQDINFDCVLEEDIDDLIIFGCAKIDSTTQATIDDFNKFGRAKINSTNQAEDVLSFLLSALAKPCRYSTLTKVNACVNFELWFLLYVSECKDDKEEQKQKLIEQLFCVRLLFCWEDELIDDFLNDNLESVTTIEVDEDGYGSDCIDEEALVRLMIAHTSELYMNINEDQAYYILSTKNLDEWLQKLQGDVDDYDRDSISHSSNSSSGDIDSLFEGFIESKFGK